MICIAATRILRTFPSTLTKLEMRLMDQVVNGCPGKILLVSNKGKLKVINRMILVVYKCISEESKITLSDLSSLTELKVVEIRCIVKKTLKEEFEKMCGEALSGRRLFRNFFVVWLRLKFSTGSRER